MYCFFFNNTAAPEIYTYLHSLSLHDALPILGEPGWGIDGVELCRFDQRVGDGGRFAAALGADEEKVLPAKGYRLHRPLGGIVIRLQEAVVEIGPKLQIGRASCRERVCQYV